MLKLLLKSGAQDLPGAEGERVLIKAVTQARFDLITCLLDNTKNEFNANVKDAKGSSSLHIAAGKDSQRLVDVLLAKGAKDCYDQQGNLAADVAAKKGHKELSNYLALQHCLDPSISLPEDKKNDQLKNQDC